MKKNWAWIITDDGNPCSQHSTEDLVFAASYAQSFHTYQDAYRQVDRKRRQFYEFRDEARRLGDDTDVSFWHRRIDNLRIIRVLVMLLLCVALADSARAQQLPDAPDATRNPLDAVDLQGPVYFDRNETLIVSPATRRLNLALYAADLTLHTLDVATTYSQMNDPCRCYVESNPIAPSGKRLAPLLAFQYGYGAAAIFASHELTKHRHPFLGRVVLLWDLGDEAYALQNNLRQHGHTAAPRGSWRPL
jgi:hypothetical protein